MADGRVVIKVDVEDREIKSLLNQLKTLKQAFDELAGVSSFSQISTQAHTATQATSKVGAEARATGRSLDEIDGDGLDSVTRSGSNAGGSLRDVSSISLKTAHNLSEIDDSGLVSVVKTSGDAGSELEGVTYSAERTSSSLADIDGSGLNSVATSGESADKSLSGVEQSAVKTATNLADIDSGGLNDVSNSSDTAKRSLDGVNYSSIEVADQIGRIDDSGLISVASASDSADKELKYMSSSAEKAEYTLSGIDGKGLDDVSSKSADAGDSLKKAGGEATDAKKKLDGIDGKNISKASSEAKVFSLTLKDLAKSSAVLITVSKGFDLISRSMGDAISRFDTLNTYPRVMQSLGYSVDSTDKSVRRLADGIEGLPTTLDEVVVTAKQIVPMIGDIDKATDTTLALNNAFLASGASVADTTRGTEQYIQMLGNGKVDLQSWRTLQETMQVALKKTAETMGYTGSGAVQQLYAGLRDGEYTFREFNDQILELNEGVNGFADMALKGSEGIATSMRNLRNAVSRHIADIMQILDDLFERVTGKTIAGNLDSLKYAINDFFAAVGRAIKVVEPLLTLFIYTVNGVIKAVVFLKPLLESLAITFLTFVTVRQAISIFESFYLELLYAKDAISVLLGVFPGMISGLRDITVTAEGTKIALLSMNGIKTVFSGLASGAASWAKTAVDGFRSVASAGGFMGGVTKLAGSALSGLASIPVAGWAAAAAGGLYLGYKWLSKVPPATQEVTDGVNKQSDATNSLVDSLEASANAYQNQQDEMASNSAMAKELAEDVARLAEQENLSSMEKAELNDKVKLLNESVAGLNLEYDSTNNLLSMGTEAIMDRVNAQSLEAEHSEEIARQTELLQEQTEVERQLTDNKKELEEAEQLLADSAWWRFLQNKELKESVEELKEKDEELKEKQVELADAYDESGNRITDIESQRAQLAEESAQRTITSIEDVEESQRGLVQTMQETYDDIKGHATNMFDTIKQNTVLSAEEIKNNLLENQETVKSWGANLEILAGKTSDEFVEQFRQMGPESAAQVAALVALSDIELQELDASFKSGADAAMEAMKSSLDIDESGLREDVISLIMATDSTFKEQLEASDLSTGISTEIKKGSEETREAAKGIGEGVAQGIEMSSEEAKSSTREMAKGIDDSFKSAMQINSPSRLFVSHGKDIVEGIKQGVNQNKASLTAVMTELGNGLTQSFSSSVKRMNSVSKGALKGFAQTVTSEVNSGKAAVSSATNAMVQSVSTMTSRLRSTVTSGMTSVSQGITAGMNKSKSTVTSSFTKIANDVKTMTDRAKNSARTGFNQMYGSINSSMNRAKSTVRSSVNSIGNTFSTLARSTYNMGWNAGMGLRNGLSASSGSIFSTARWIANSVASTIRSALRIHSPSRVLFGLGEDTGDGFEYGIASKIKDVKRTARELAEASIVRVDMAKSLGFAGGGASHLTNNSYSIQNTLNVTNNGEQTSDQEFFERLLEEFAWYVGREGGMDT